MYKHILVPLDSSNLAEKALPHAEQLAESTGARITLLSCVEPYVIIMPMVPAPAPSYEIDTDLDALVADREEYLGVIRDVLVDKGFRVDTVVLRGRPPDEILHYVEQNDVDLITMTTHGRSGLSRFIYGSVAERVLHGAKVPVLLIRITE